MAFLLDTHSFLWFVEGSSLLSVKARETIEANEGNQISIASIWEISIKASLGKLIIKGDFNSVLEDIINNNISILPISFSNTNTLFNLPFYHRDPFDRMIISQAIDENMNIISRDEIFDVYLSGKNLKRIW